MKRFAYKAKDALGETRQGKVEARDLESAAATLRGQQLVIIEIKPVSESSLFGGIAEKMGRVGQDDVVTFTRQLATMISSGLPLTEALSILEIQSKPGMAKVINEVVREIQAGGTLSDAMSKHPEAFSGVYVSLIRAGEASGKIDTILVRLAENLEKQKEFRSKTRGALVYPAIVIVFMFVVATIMMVVVVPELAKMFEDFDAELPLVTQMLISTSEFVQQFWYVVIVLIAGSIYGFRRYVRTETGALSFDRFMLRVPVFGPLRTQVTLAELTRTLSLLIGAGVSIIQALEISSSVVGNLVYRRSIESTIKELKKGVPFSVAVMHEEIFPPIMPNMISVGEETGKMDDVLMKVSSYFEEEAEQKIKNLTTALEPLIMIVLGVGVGFLVLAIIMPIYDLTNQF